MAKKKPMRAQTVADDLKKIEGIGPKIEKLLHQDGIDSFSKLARASTKRLHGILDKAGPLYRSHDPGTWKEQSALAAKDNWEELRALQKKLIGGRDYSKKVSNQSAAVVFSAIGGGNYEPGKPFVIERLVTSEEAKQEYLVRKAELDKDFAKAERSAKELWKRLTKLEEFRQHVTGISVRYRTKFGQVVSPLRVVVAVNVARKLSDEQLKSQKLTCIRSICQTLPKNLEFETKVLEGRFVYLDGSSALLLRGTSSPVGALAFDEVVTGGVPIHRPADPISTFGTLGLVSTASGRSAFGLTAQHIVGTDSVVEQIDPAGNDRKIGEVKDLKQAPFKVDTGSGPETIDAAIFRFVGGSASPTIKLPSDGEWARGVSHKSDESPPSSSSAKIYFSKRRVNTADRFTKVFKFGNGSGLTIEGEIDSSNQSSTIRNDDYQGNFTIKLWDNANGSFATPGDSGSIIATRVSKVNGKSESAIVIIGILFASLTDRTTGLACNMNAIVKAYDLERTFKGSLFADDWE